MNKMLRFEIKHNLRRASRIYVKSTDLKTIYGFFHADNPVFENWDKLNPDQVIELTLFIQNIEAVNAILGNDYSSKLIDFRFRLPIDLVCAISELTALFASEQLDCNVFEAAITAMTQQLKISTAQLPDKKKQQALSVLDKVGLADYKKLDLTTPIQSVFSELLAIHNKSEKLHQKALSLFDKNKSYSPEAIKGMTKGDSIPSKWLVACAIDVLLDEKASILKTFLTNNDLFLLWVKPLLANGYNLDELLTKAHKIALPELETKIKEYVSLMQD